MWQIAINYKTPLKILYYVVVQFVIICNYLPFATMFIIFTTTHHTFKFATIFCDYGATTKLNMLTYWLPYWLTYWIFHPRIFFNIFTMIISNCTIDIYLPIHLFKHQAMQLFPIVLLFINVFLFFKLGCSFNCYVAT
jgi:hypothetical protein